MVLSTRSLGLWQRAHPFLSEQCSFFRPLNLGVQLSLYSASSLFGTQQQLTHPLVKSSYFLAYCLVFSSHYSAWYHILPLSFVTHPYYSLNPYVHLYYMQSIPIVKNRRYPKYFILSLVHSQGKDHHIQNILFYVFSMSMVKDHHFAEKCSQDYGKVRKIRLHFFYFYFFWTKY